MRRLALVLLVAVTLAVAARADDDRPAVLRNVGIDPHLGATLPLELAFRDETGAPVTLGRYFDGRPVLLSLVYFGCPMLCSQVLQGLAASLRAVGFDAGREFTAVTVSFDPHDDPDAARDKKAEVLAQYHPPTAAGGWHFLTGDPEAIGRLTDAVGFRYNYDASGRQFAHVPAVIVLTPEGRIARYFSGVEIPARDLRLGLVEAAAHRIGTTIDRILLFCFHYDATAGGALTLLGLGALVGVLIRQDKAGRKRAG